MDKQKKEDVGTTLTSSQESYEKMIASYTLPYISATKLNNCEEIYLSKITPNYNYIYFLISKEYEIVYIGSTCNIYTRLSSHLNSNKNFESIKFFQVPKEIASEIEADLIIKYDPKYNLCIPNNELWISLARYKKIDVTAKGNLVKIRKILKQKGWKFHYDCLRKSQWEEICELLRTRGNHE